MDILEVDGVTLSFGGVKALAEVSLGVAEGSITAVIGPNGAGKTSLFNVISGFYTPQAGRVRFAGTDITRTPASRRAALGIARTFQNISLFDGLSVLDNIKLGAHAHLTTGPVGAGLYLGRARREECALGERIDREIVDFLQLGSIRHARVAALPYGLRKRVELARALAMRPRLLLLDEPAAGMTREEKQAMTRVVRDIRDRWRAAILLIEHDMSLVMDTCDRVVVLNFGRRIAAGRPAEVQTDPEVVRAYLGDMRDAALA